MSTSPVSGPGVAANSVGAAQLVSSQVNRDGLRLQGENVLVEPFPALASTVGSSLTSGTIYALAVGLRAGDVLTNLFTNVVVAGSGTAPTLIRQGVADSNRVIRALTADTHADAQWLSTGITSFPLSAAYTAPADGLYYLCIIQVGAFGTTALNIRKCTVPIGLPAVAGGVVISGNQNGQTDLPTVGNAMTLATSSTNSLWLAAN